MSLGSTLGRGGVWEASAFFLPNEKALPAASRERPEVDSGTGGGSGISNRSLEIGGGLSSRVMSVDEGNVEVELNRADAEEKSLPPLDLELFVPPLPLTKG